jgi:FixJ family two-component response regulator
MAAQLRNCRLDKPKFMGHRRCAGGILAHIGQFHAECRHSWLPARRVQRMAKGGMMKKVLVSVVDDDRFCRESMCRLMRSLGHTVDVFSSAAEFLASPRFAETACLIADVHMPAMTGLELYRRLVDTGQAIPTILVTAFPNDVDRARALNDGVMCYLRKPVEEERLTRCVREALRFAESPEEEP